MKLPCGDTDRRPLQTKGSVGPSAQPNQGGMVAKRRGPSTGAGGSGSRIPGSRRPPRASRFRHTSAMLEALLAVALILAAATAAAAIYMVYRLRTTFDQRLDAAARLIAGEWAARSELA